MDESQAGPISTPPDGRPDAQQPVWRRDFPIDWPQDHYVSRREFIKFLTLTSLAFAVGQVWIGMQSLYRRSRGKPAARAIASVEAIPVGSILRFSYPEEKDHCLLFRTGEQTYLAFSQQCTHLGCAVVPDMPNKRLLCPCHHGVFDATNGRPLAGPPRRPLPKITIEVRGNQIYATGVEEGQV